VVLFMGMNRLMQDNIVNGVLMEKY
jgi:hypothetical protein